MARKKDELLVTVSELIFLERKRVIWQGIANQGRPAAHSDNNRTEFEEQYECQPQKRAGQSR
jgi:hypothetical protein